MLGHAIGNFVGGRRRPPNVSAPDPFSVLATEDEFEGTGPVTGWDGNAAFTAKTGTGEFGFTETDRLITRNSTSAVNRSRVGFRPAATGSTVSYVLVRYASGTEYLRVRLRVGTTNDVCVQKRLSSFPLAVISPVVPHTFTPGALHAVEVTVDTGGAFTVKVDGSVLLTPDDVTDDSLSATLAVGIRQETGFAGTTFAYFRNHVKV